jgi:hypothetical protein
MKRQHHIKRLLCVVMPVLICLVCLSGCAVLYKAPVKPPMGLLYANYKAPLTVDFDGNPTGGNLIKASESKTHYIFIPFIYIGLAFGDAEIAGIAKEAGIETISYVDHEFYNILGIYARFTIHIYGYGPGEAPAAAEADTTASPHTISQGGA